MSGYIINPYKVQPVAAGVGPYDVDSSNYNSVSLSNLTQTANPAGGFRFNNTGTKAYTLEVNGAGSTMREWNLSTPYDIATATYGAASGTFLFSGTVHNFDWSPNGSRVQIIDIGTAGPNINAWEFLASTNFDVTSINTAAPGGLAPGAPVTNPACTAWRPDGLKFYQVESSNNTIARYSTGIHDATSASFDSGQTLSLNAQDTAIEAVTFSPDGSKLLAVGNTNNKIYRWGLSTPWDLTTGAFEVEFDISGQVTDPSGVAFDSTGLRYSVVNGSTRVAYQYDIA